MFKLCYRLVMGNASVYLRTFHTFDARLNKYASREARIMRKLMNSSSSKKKSWYTPDSINNRPSMPTPSSIHQGHHSDRRVAVLNKLFMRHITDLMVTGEIASQILNHGIEISRVKVALDFTRVNVYWLAKGSKHGEDTEKILMNYAGKLRHGLAQLRLMGSLPTIEFVKDKDYGKLIDVDRLLAVADFGEDYTPLDPSHHLKSEFILNTQFPASVKEHLELSPEHNHFYEDTLPSMRMDVLGVNQLDIMTKVKKSLRKSQALHRTRLSAEPQLASTEKLVARCEEAKQSDGNIKEFLLKQQHARRKLQRGVKNYRPEYELMERDLEWQRNVEFCDEEDQDFDDVTDTEDDKY